MAKYKPLKENTVEYYEYMAGRAFIRDDLRMMRHYIKKAQQVINKRNKKIQEIIYGQV